MKVRAVFFALVVALAGLLLGGLLSRTPPATAQVAEPAPLSTGGAPVAVSEAVVQRFIRSVTVQVIVRLERYTRPLEWYQEVTADGKRGDWKVRHGKWSEKPEQIVVAGTGVIVYSLDGGPLSGTYILTNAHVVEYLTSREKLGSPEKPFDFYEEKDLIIHTMPPNITIREGARPVSQYFFRLPTNYVEIKYREDQFFTVYAKIVDYDLALDVALLQVCTPDGKPANVWGLTYVTLRDVDPFLGEEVWICGAPLGIPFSIDRGRVNQVGLDLGKAGGIVWNKQIKIDIAAAPGSSGSGIFDKHGKLCALLHGTLVYAGQIIRGGQLAIPVTLIREWLIWRGWAFVVTAPPHVSAPYFKPAG